MAYTKAVAIEQVYLLLVGGKPNTVTAVMREDIEPYLLAACQWAWDEDIKERKLTELRAKRSGVSYTYSESDIRTVQELTVTKDTSRNAQYVTVPFRIHSYGGQMIWDVYPLQGFEPFHKIQSRSDLAGFDDTMGVNFSLLENRQNEQRIYLYGSLFDSVVLELPFDFNALKETDLLPIPAGKETAVIEKCVQFFSVQKAQSVNDEKEEENEGS